MFYWNALSMKFSIVLENSPMSSTVRLSLPFNFKNAVLQEVIDEFIPTIEIDIAETSSSESSGFKKATSLLSVEK